MPCVRCVSRVRPQRHIRREARTRSREVECTHRQRARRRTPRLWRALGQGKAPHGWWFPHVQVQTLLQQMQSKFEQMSDGIIEKIDDMGKRVDDLEKNIAELMKQAGIEELPQDAPAKQ
eukprot:TRINITY_DN1803_c0_g1_i2.p1 TRINITY_DN1803_c0_g1~~TRINITY_DN1803_c0_g1_i2.p1  ORF type:complete len:119 (-),score=32.91 TRINITY_DN1803_c0_g1_i2:52-408(-)